MTREEIMQLNTDYLNGCESEHKMNELFNYVLELQKHEQQPSDTVQIVIKLSDETYKDIKEENSIYGINNGLSARITGKVVGAIQNGTPLPKGHGRLIDAKEFIKSITDWADNVNNYEAYEELEIAKALLQSYAHTIIEAESEE